MNLEIHTKQTEEGIVIEPAGRIDTSTAESFEKAVLQAAETSSAVTIDLQNTQYISSAGLRVLLLAYKKLSGTGKFEVIHVNEVIRDIFDVTGFTDIFMPEDSRNGQ